ncbi:MAG: hypothetical protein Q8O30_08450 [Candidatus Omnitrophota bacterium]|nr:hypothetical protein [Candidatus Omnitrophota bacterium]
MSLPTSLASELSRLTTIVVNNYNNFKLFFTAFRDCCEIPLFRNVASKKSLKNQPVSTASRGVCSILILSLVHSLPWNEVNYVYDFGFIPVASHGVFAERE